MSRDIEKYIPSEKVEISEHLERGILVEVVKKLLSHENYEYASNHLPENLDTDFQEPIWEIQEAVGSVLTMNNYLNRDKKFKLKERKLLKFLIKHPWEVHSRKSLIEFLCVWEETYNTYITSIRKQLSKRECFIENSSWDGYYLRLWEFSLDMVWEKVQLWDDTYYIPQLRSLYINNELKSFPPAEQKMLDFFISSPWKVHSRATLLDALWDNWNINDRTIDIYIKRLRKKIGTNKNSIHTIYWKWYYMNLGEINLENINDKVEICRKTFFIPNLCWCFITWETNDLVMKFSHNESDLLDKMYKNPNRIYSRYSIQNFLWIDEDTDERVVDTYIRRLRKKLNSLEKDLGKSIVTHSWEWYSWK